MSNVIDIEYTKPGDFDGSGNNSSESLRPGAVYHSRRIHTVIAPDGKLYGVYTGDDGFIHILKGSSAEWTDYLEPMIQLSGTNPHIVVDQYGCIAIVFEQGGSVFVYDERLLDSTKTPYLTEIGAGSQPAIIIDYNLDLLLFYRRDDGVFCWRSRSQTPYDGVWPYDNEISDDFIPTGGTPYLEDALINNSNFKSWEHSSIVLIFTVEDSEGNYSWAYTESMSRDLSIVQSETVTADVSLTDIFWAFSYIFTPSETLGADVSLQSIQWTSTQPAKPSETLTANVNLQSIYWVTARTVSPLPIDTLTTNVSLQSIGWTPNNTNTPKETLACQVSLQSITWG